MKSFYLHYFYEMSLKYYNTISSIKDIASLDILQANKNLDWYNNNNENGNDIENEYKTKTCIIKCNKTLRQWFYSFRVSDYFPNVAKAQSAKSKMPFFLSENPDIVSRIINHCRDNISTISCESVHS